MLRLMRRAFSPRGSSVPPIPGVAPRANVPTPLWDYWVALSIFYYIWLGYHPIA